MLERKHSMPWPCCRVGEMRDDFAIGTVCIQHRADTKRAFNKKTSKIGVLCAILGQSSCHGRWVGAAEGVVAVKGSHNLGHGVQKSNVVRACKPTRIEQ